MSRSRGILGANGRTKVTWALALIAFAILATLHYRYVVIHLAPAKRGTIVRSAAALKADERFWSVFHAGAYDEIPDVFNVLGAAYLQTPTDAVTAAHIGFMHMWRLTERSRLASVPPTIADHAMLARRYFAEAVRLDPSDARYAGFLASAMLSEAIIHKDERLLRRGYYTLLDAVDAWPEFNLFTAGYVMSRQPVDSTLFRDALDWQWRNIDVCAGEKVDRTNPDVSKYMHLETIAGHKRVCWNSWIAPHNFEGFFMNMGDMLVRAGDWQMAQKIYANAKLSRTYGQWKYRTVLEERIAQARANVVAFNDDGPGGKPMMINSTFTCMACHQE